MSLAFLREWVPVNKPKNSKEKVKERLFFSFRYDL